MRSLLVYGATPDAIDLAVREQLAQSLGYVLTQAGGYLDYDRRAATAMLQAIQSHRIDPGVFARYYDLVFAISGNKFSDANVLVKEIGALAVKPVKFAIRPFSDIAMGSDNKRYQRLLFSENSRVGQQVAPDAAVFADRARCITEAMAIIARIEPSIAAEIDGLLSQVYVTKDADRDDGASYGGVTSFMIWGANFMNCGGYATSREAVQFLVHEITHSLLFGLGSQEPLVLNSPQESFRSPLRTDPRPMDGVYHAALVCARLAHFNRLWLESGIVKQDEIEKTEQAVILNLESFRDGAETIATHGKLSGLGQELFDQCRAGLVN